MSRKSRKSGTSNCASWLSKAALGLILAGLLLSGLLYIGIRGYLHSDAFRHFLSIKVSESAQVNGYFTPFQWDGLAVESSSFVARGDSVIKSLNLDSLHTEIGVGGLRRGVWEIKESRAQRLEIALDSRNPSEVIGRNLGEAKKNVLMPRQRSSWLPREVELQGVDVGELVLKAQFDHGLVSSSGMKVRIESGGVKHGYRIGVLGGVIQMSQSFAPELHLNEANFRYQDGLLFLNRVNATIWNDGMIHASGEWDKKTKMYCLEGTVSGVRCEKILNDNWAKRLTGDINSGFSLDNHRGKLVARGRLAVQNGMLTALPILDSLAAYADTRRFRVLSLSDASTDWRWKNGELFLSNVVIVSEGLARLEGSVSIQEREIDGTFRLGLVPGTLSKIPGAETDVFTAGERGLLWAHFRITGTFDHPKEDLTEQLITAAGGRMFDVIPETGQKAIRFSRSLLQEAPLKTVDRSFEIIEQGVGAVDQIGDVIDGFFGKENQSNPKNIPSEK